jgi:ABC-type branched-subunit amino acid transport system substrate-binding protein
VSKKRISAAVVCVFLVAVLVVVLAGCGGSTTSTSSQTKGSTAGGAKVIKIGAMDNLGSATGVDQKKCLEVAVDLLNKQGGLTIDDQKYTVQLVMYDDGGDSAKGRNAFNKLVEQDKVSFVLGDFFVTDSLLPLAEKAHVVLSCQALSPAFLNPAYKYSFNTAALSAQATAAVGWMGTAYPGQSAVIALPDDMPGHATGANVQKAMKAFGLKGQAIYFPANTTDFSSVATRVKGINPQLFGATGEATIYKAVRESGYKGQLAGFGIVASANLLAQVPASELEGFVGPAYYTEFDTPPTQLAKDFKQAYIGKYGKWDDPSVAGLGTFYAVIAGIQKANSIDPTQVANALANGLTYESPGQSYQMVARPDMKITRTVDSVTAFAIKKIVDGKPTILANITVAQAVEYQNKVNASSK